MRPLYVLYFAVAAMFSVAYFQVNNEKTKSNWVKTKSNWVTVIPFSPSVMFFHLHFPHISRRSSNKRRYAMPALVHYKRLTIFDGEMRCGRSWTVWESTILTQMRDFVAHWSLIHIYILKTISFDVDTRSQHSLDTLVFGNLPCSTHHSTRFPHLFVVVCRIRNLVIALIKSHLSPNEEALLQLDRQDKIACA